MANLGGMMDLISISARNIYDNVATTLSSVNLIDQSWEGADYEAFREAYEQLYTKTCKLDDQYKALKSQLSSLQSSIDAAEQDKQNKKMQKKRW